MSRPETKIQLISLTQIAYLRSFNYVQQSLAKEKQTMDHYGLWVEIK